MKKMKKMKKMSNNDVHGFIDELLDKGKFKFMAFEANKVRDYLEKQQEVFTLRPLSNVTEKFVETPVGYFFAVKVAQVMPVSTNYENEWIEKSGFGSKKEWDNALCEMAKDYGISYWKPLYEMAKEHNISDRGPLINLYNLYHLISIDRYFNGKDIPEAFVKKHLNE